MNITLEIPEEQVRQILLSSLATNTLILDRLDVQAQFLNYWFKRLEGKLMATEAQIIESLAAANTQLADIGVLLGRIGDESTATLAALKKAQDDLAALIAAGQGTSVAVDEALATLKTSLDAATGLAHNVDNLVPDITPPVATPTL